MKRIIGEYRSRTEGPVLIVTAGIHGNEPAGIVALENVFAQLKHQKPAVTGALIGVLGNLSAIKAGRRFIDQDLNRMFKVGALDALRKQTKSKLKSVEEREQLDLLRLFETGILRRYEGHELFMLDLHTTSSEGGSFTIAADKPKSVEIARKLGVTVIVGMENVIHGTTLDYFNQLNGTGIGFEAGQHEEKASIDRMEAVIWVKMVELGIIKEEWVPKLEEHRSMLCSLRKSAPAVVRFSYRHAVQPEDRFQMLPGFKNFDPIVAGQKLATSRLGDITSPVDGLMLMPLYQPQGSDGFFIVQSVEQTC